MKSNRNYLVVIGVLALIVVGFAAFTAYHEAVGQPRPPFVVSPDQNLPEPDVRVDGVRVSGELITLLQTNGMSRADAINAAIDNTVIFDSARRLGVAPTDAEVRSCIQEYEQRLQSVPSEQRAEYEAALTAQGFPISGLADDPQVFELFRVSCTMANVRNFVLEREVVSDLTGTPADQIPDQRAVTALEANLDPGAIDEAKRNALGRIEPEVQNFIQQERQKADITVSDPVNPQQ